jgi:hypothetical protein
MAVRAIADVPTTPGGQRTNSMRRSLRSSDT